MLHSRVIVLDASGTSAVGSATAPPARYSGVFYHFDDPAASATITVTNKGQTLFTKVGATNADGLTPYDQTKREPPVSGEIIADVHSIVGGSPDEKLDVTVLLDFGGAG